MFRTISVETYFLSVSGGVNPHVAHMLTNMTKFGEGKKERKRTEVAWKHGRGAAIARHTRSTIRQPRIKSEV